MLIYQATSGHRGHAISFVVFLYSVPRGCIYQFKATSAREKESIRFQSLIILALGLDKNIEAETGFAEFQGCFKTRRTL